MFKAFSFCCNVKSLGIRYPPPDCVLVPNEPDGACTDLAITLLSASTSLLIVNLVIAPLSNPFNATNGSGVTSKNVGATNSITPLGCSSYFSVPPFQHCLSTLKWKSLPGSLVPVWTFAPCNVINIVPNVVPNPAAFNTVPETVIVSPAT